MELDASSLGPSGDVQDPAVLVLAGQSIISETADSAHLYQIGRDVTSTSPADSTVRFERAEYGLPDNDQSKSPGGSQKQKQHLFYLVHPVGAQYRTDLPAHYYMTSAVPGMIGNIRFETSKARLQRTGFRAFLSPKRSARDQPLFDNDKTRQQLLFNATPKWKGCESFTWTDAGGRKVAYEDEDGQHKLVVTLPMPLELRDALVALWILRLWHDIAETRHAKRECKLVSC